MSLFRRHRANSVIAVDLAVDEVVDVHASSQKARQFGDIGFTGDVGVEFVRRHFAVEESDTHFESTQTQYRRVV